MNKSNGEVTLEEMKKLEDEMTAANELAQMAIDRLSKIKRVFRGHVSATGLEALRLRSFDIQALCEKLYTEMVG